MNGTAAQPTEEVIAVDHTVAVKFDSSRRYPHFAECACGWYSRGYVHEHAAQLMADDHVSEVQVCSTCGNPVVPNNLTIPCATPYIHEGPATYPQHKARVA